jgi:hypothetical protein
MAAEESARFHRYSAVTNVDDDVLDQMAADVAELAGRYQLDPPVTVFSRLLRTRDDVFALIAGRQQPRHTTNLYKIAGQLCGLLALATFDLGYPHAAETHARTAPHCAEVSVHTPSRVFIRWVQSNIAYGEGRHEEAAQLMESALPDATSGTTLLRLASQQASIHAARCQPGEVSEALAFAATALPERSVEESGIFGFDLGIAAYYASEAHCAPGGIEHSDAAVEWAVTVWEEFTAEFPPKVLYVAPPVSSSRWPTWAGVSWHPGRVAHRAGDQSGRFLRTLLAQRSDLASGILSALRDDLAEFCTHPAPTLAGLELEVTT